MNTPDDNEKDAPQDLHEDQAELVKLLGEPFAQLIKNLEEAELKLAGFVDDLQRQERDMPRRDEEARDTVLKTLRFLSCMMARKAGVYAAGAAIGYEIPPTLTFETVQNNVLRGLHTAVMKHREVCGNPDCDATQSTLKFLAHVHASYERMLAASMQSFPRDRTGKPIIH